MSAAEGSPAIVAVTAHGSSTAARIAAALPGSTAYVPERFLPLIGVRPHPNPLPPGRGETSASQVSTRPGSWKANVCGHGGSVRPIVTRLFRAGHDLVLVMAAGAAVRLVAPLLADKRRDPAVVVVDDAGRYAISLLSGHLGGANGLARRVAAAIDAQAIITTASESAGVPAADLIGRGLGWRIEPCSALKRVAAALVNGDRVALYQECGSRHWFEGALPQHVIAFPTLEAAVEAGADAVILISDRLLELPAALRDRWAVYRPPTLVAGVGCSRGAPASEIGELLDSALAEAGLSPLSVAAPASIDLKGDEPGLVALAAQRGWPLRTFSAAELERAPGAWSRSETVRRAVGVAGVAEPAALLAAGAETLVLRKVKSRRVTAAIARIPEPADSSEEQHG